MKIRKITAISVGALILASGISFVSGEVMERESVIDKRGHTGDTRPSTEAPSVFISSSEMRKEPYVYMDTKRSVLSRTNAPKIAEMIKSLAPKDQKNVALLHK